MTNRGPLIKDARGALGFSRRDLAVALEMNMKSIAEFECGAHPARRTVLLAIECLLRRKGLTAAADAFHKQTGGRP